MNNSENNNEKKPKYLEAIELIGQMITPFYGKNEEVFFEYNNGTFNEVYPVRSKKLRQIISSRYFSHKNRILGEDDFQKIIGHYEAVAYENGTTKDVFIRTVFHNGEIYYDLNNPNGEMIRISSTGWNIVQYQESPIFTKTNNMLPATTPVRENADFNLLRKHLQIKDDDNWYLTAAFILGSLYRSPYTILIHNGEQGTGKSTKSKMIAKVIDPSSAPLSTKPNSEKDLFITASKCHLLCFDNISSIKNWFSDLLCIISTGGGYRSRQLYTDDGEKIFNVSCPMQLNGISDFTTRGDLIDRSLIIQHDVIPPSSRMTDHEIWDSFNNDLPRIMGGLFNALHTALKNLPNVKVDELPRMADFAKFGCAASEALGITQERFMQAYQKNLDDSNLRILEVDPVACALNSFLDHRGEWRGVMTDLRDELLAYIPVDLHNTNYIPRAAHSLSNKIKRIAPMLRRQGIQVIPDRSNQARGYIITKTKKYYAGDASDTHLDQKVVRGINV